MDNQPAANGLLELTSKEAVRLIQRGDLSAESYAQRLLQQYAETRTLNAITWIKEDRVLELARAVDVARSKGQKLGPLAGLPVVIKDNINTVGFPTTAGTAALKGYLPEKDATVADVLFKNGAILLGKTNMDELGREFTTSNPTYGFTKNPYDLNRVPGGGAGGSAAAIAGRITPAGLGSDTAGSIRVPGSFCGIAGIRPSSGGRLNTWTLGSWSSSSVQDGIAPIAFASTTTGPMGRTVSDVALLHAIVTGGAVPEALPLRGARLGVPRAFYWDDLDPEVRRVCERALEKLRAAGAVLVDVDLLQWAQIADPTFFVVSTMHALQDLGDFLATYKTGVTIDQVVAGLADKAVSARVQHSIDVPVTADQATQAQKTRPELVRQYEDVFQRYNIAAIVFPTVPILPPPINPKGNSADDTVELNGKQVNRFLTSLRNTHLASVAGTPSLIVPAGLSSSGLPIGLSLDGLTGTDARLLGLGLAVEAALGRLPAPAPQASVAQQRPSPVSASSPQPPRSNDTVDHALTVLKQSAYVNFHVSLPGMSASGFKVQAQMRRYDADFRIAGCGPGIRAVNLVGGECGRAGLNWAIEQTGATRKFTMDDTFDFDCEGKNRLRGSGQGRMLALPLGNGRFGVDATGNLSEGSGVFAGAQGSYVLTGTGDNSGLNLHFTMRLMDPAGNFLTSSSLLELNGTQPSDRLTTCLMLLGEPDPERPIQLGPSGSNVHALLRAVHTDFDRGRSNDALRSGTSLGPIVAHYSADVMFNPAELSGPGAAGRSTPVKMQNIKIDFCEGAGGGLEAGIDDGRAFAMALPGLSGPLFRMTGYGAIARGTGRFANVQGMLSMIAASDLAPAAFSNLYILHLIDPNGSFRC